MIKLVIFDMDGLMIDSECIAKETWRQALDFFGYSMDEKFFSTLLGQNADLARARICEHYGNDFNYDPIRKKQHALWKNHIEIHGINTKKGLLPLLDYLDQIGIKKCIATSTAFDYMQYKLKHVRGIDLLSRFDGYITGCQVENSKPNPEIFLKAACLMGIAPENCIVLEDSAAGVLAGVAAGMKVFLVPDMVEPNENIIRMCFAKCEDLTEVAKKFLQIM